MWPTPQSPANPTIQFHPISPIILPHALWGPKYSKALLEWLGTLSWPVNQVTRTSLSKKPWKSAGWSFLLLLPSRSSIHFGTLEALEPSLGQLPLLPPRIIQQILL